MFKFRRSKKLISALLVIVMVLTAVPFSVSAENNPAPAIEFTDEIVETGETLVYQDKTLNNGGFMGIAPMSTYNGLSVNYYDSGNRTFTANDAIDFYCFSAPTARSVVVSFTSGNPNYLAILASHNTSTGNVTLTNLQISSGNPVWFELPAGNWCWVVLSANNTYTSSTYRLIWNGYNPANAIQNQWYTTNLVETAFLYSGNVLRINGYTLNDNPTANQITITGYTGGNGIITYPGYGSRHRFNRSSDITVHGNVSYYGMAVPYSLVRVVIVNNHWSMLPDTTTMEENVPWRYQIAYGYTNGNGDFSIGITVNSCSPNGVTVSGTGSSHVLNYLTYVTATCGSAYTEEDIFIVGWSSYG